MNKCTRRFAVQSSLALMAFVAVLTLPLWTRADSRSESILPQMGMMRSSQNVTLVNLEPVTVVVKAGSALPITMLPGEQCYMPKGTPFVAVGIDGDRVLVRSRQTGDIYLHDEGWPKCNHKALFWVHKQEFILSAAEYRKAEQDRVARQSERERERSIIRRLLDEELAGKRTAEAPPEK